MLNFLKQMFNFFNKMLLFFKLELHKFTFFGLEFTFFSRIFTFSRFFLVFSFKIGAFHCYLADLGQLGGVLAAISRPLGRYEWDLGYSSKVGSSSLG